MLLRQRLPGKLRTRCDGPYVFLRSLGKNSATLELLGANGKVRVASVANVVPYRGLADDDVSRPAKVRITRAGHVDSDGVITAGNYLEPRGPS